MTPLAVDLSCKLIELNFFFAEYRTLSVLIVHRPCHRARGRPRRAAQRHAAPRPPSCCAFDSGCDKAGNVIKLRGETGGRPTTRHGPRPRRPYWTVPTVCMVGRAGGVRFTMGAEHNSPGLVYRVSQFIQECSDCTFTIRVLSYAGFSHFLSKEFTPLDP